MASEAEVDLIISTADTLPELERDLQRIIRVAEDGAETLDVEAALAVGASLSTLAEELEQVIQAAENGADNVELQAALDAQQSLNHIQGQIESIRQRVEQGEEIDLRAELDQVGSLTGIQNQLRSMVREVEATAPEIELEVEIDRDGSGRNRLAGLGRGLATLVGPLARVSAGIGGVAVAASSLAPLLAGLATSVANIAPASAVAVSGMLALTLATNTVKLAMQGVGDAITTAFDPEAKPEDLAKAMEKLSPAAKAFVTELSGMRKEFKSLQQGVQENFFKGFAAATKELGTTVLPVVSNALKVTSQTLNQMALGAASAASQLGKDGTLGNALSSANIGLFNLSKLPAQLVTGLGQIAAAAGPAFERLTAGAGRAATEISERLSKAFESGALEGAINNAIEAVKQLGRVFGNIFEGLGNVIRGFQVEGEGLFGTLEKITQAFADVTATQGFQDALKALNQVLSVIVSTALPVLSQALQALGPVFQALSGPLQSLVKTLGTGLSKIITALGPVLVSLANVFGKLVEAASPIIDLFSTLIAAILPALTPLFNALSRILAEITPFIEQLAKNLAAQLLPVFTALATEVLPKILPPLVELATKIFPILTKILEELGPSLAKLGETFGELLVALAPVIEQIAILIGQMLDELMPILQPLIDLLAKVVSGGLEVISSFVSGILVPALKILVDFLKGDWNAAWEGVKKLAVAVKNKFVEEVEAMRDRAIEAFISLARRAGEKAGEMARDVGRKAEEMVNDFINNVKTLPDRAAESLANSGRALVQAGANLVQGFIDGIRSKIGEVQEAARKLAASVASFVGIELDMHSPSRVMRDLGKNTAEGYRLGIRDSLPDLRREIQGMASLAPSFALPNGDRLTLPQFNQSVPTVQVFLGNQLLDQHIDTRITTSNQARDRLAVQGVRR